MEVRLRPALDADDHQFRAAHAALMASDGFALGLNYDPSEPFDVFVQRQRNFARGLELPPGLVPATFLLAVVGDDIVGRVSIRHELNEFLAAEGGHIGYGVLEQFRRCGYATQMLEQSVIIARSLGIETALLVCDDVNHGSAVVIERCGGVLRDRRTDSEGTLIRRYDIGL